MVRTTATFSQQIWDFLKDSTPARRRQRYGDVDYDWEHRVDTTGATVSFRNRLLGMFHSPYQPTDEQAFREMIGGLKVNYSQFTFIDLGSGKGRTLLMAAEYNFRRVVGVELLPELHQVAEDNIRKFQEAGKANVSIASVLADARYFEFPLEPTVLYLFNPFPEPVLEEVISRLDRSLQEHPRALYVVYHNPLLEPVVASAPALKLVTRSPQHAVYASAAQIPDPVRDSEHLM